MTRGGIGQQKQPSREFVQICGHLPQVSKSNIPSGYKHTMKHSELWRESMELEYKILMECKVWKLGELPPGAKLMGGKWVFAIKHGASGEIVRRKAHYVAQGFTQVFGLYYESVHILFTIIA